MYKSLTLKKVALKNPSKNGNGNGKIFKTKNIEPTIVKGIEAIPAAMTARTILSCAIFPIGPIRYFCKKSNINYSPFLNTTLFHIVLYGYTADLD